MTAADYDAMLARTRARIAEHPDWAAVPQRWRLAAALGTLEGVVGVLVRAVRDEQNENRHAA